MRMIILAGLLVSASFANTVYKQHEYAEQHRIAKHCGQQFELGDCAEFADCINLDYRNGRCGSAERYHRNVYR
jgi:hypothetical protein